MKLPCPECGKTLSASTEDIGKKVRCSNCGAVFVIPGRGAEEGISNSEKESLFDFSEAKTSEEPSYSFQRFKGGPESSKLKELSLATHDTRVTNSLAIAAFLFGIFTLLVAAGCFIALTFAGISSQTIAGMPMWIVFVIGLAGGVLFTLMVLPIFWGIIASGRIKRSGGAQKGRLISFLGAVFALLSIAGLSTLFYFKNEKSSNAFAQTIVSSVRQEITRPVAQEKKSNEEPPIEQAGAPAEENATLETGIPESAPQTTPASNTEPTATPPEEAAPTPLATPPVPPAEEAASEAGEAAAAPAEAPASGEAVDAESATAPATPMLDAGNHNSQEDTPNQNGGSAQ